MVVAYVCEWEYMSHKVDLVAPGTAQPYTPHVRKKLQWLQMAVRTSTQKKFLFQVLICNRKIFMINQHFEIHISFLKSQCQQTNTKINLSFQPM